MDAVGVRVRVADVQPQLFRGARQLPIHVLPFAHAQEIQVFVFHLATELVAAELFLPLFEVVPEVQQGQEVARRVGKSRMLLVGLRAPFQRALARILDAQPRNDHHHLTSGGVLLRLDHHACQPRVDRQLAELFTDARDRRIRGDRVQFAQQVEPVFDAAGFRRLQKREGGDLAEPERDHLQDDRSQVGTQDLGFGELGPLAEVLLRVEPDGDAVARATGPTAALVGRRLADRLDRQPLDLGSHAVPADARGAGVDDIPDAGHRQARLRDVRRQHYAAAGSRSSAALEHPVLVCGAEATVEREHLGSGQVPTPDGVFRIPDLVLA